MTEEKEYHSKANDPSTGYDAEKDITPKLGRLVRWALGIYAQNEGSTTGEIAAYLGGGATVLYDFRRRISDAKKRGLLEVSGTRPCGESGKRCEVYTLTETGAKLLKNYPAPEAGTIRAEYVKQVSPEKEEKVHKWIDWPDEEGEWVFYGRLAAHTKPRHVLVTVTAGQHGKFHVTDGNEFWLRSDGQVGVFAVIEDLPTPPEPAGKDPHPTHGNPASTTFDSEGQAYFEF